MNSDTAEEILHNLSDSWVSSSSETATLHGYPQGIRTDDSGDDSDDSGITLASQPRGTYGAKQSAYRRRTLRRQKDDIRRFPAGMGLNAFGPTSAGLGGMSEDMGRLSAETFMNLEGREGRGLDDSLLKKPSTFRLSAYCRCERYDLDSLHEAIATYASIYRVQKDKKTVESSVILNTPLHQAVVGAKIPQLDELSIPEDLFPPASQSVNQEGLNMNVEGLDHDTVSSQDKYALSEDFRDGSSSIDTGALASTAKVVKAPLTQPGEFIQQVENNSGIQRSLSDFTREYANQGGEHVALNETLPKLPVKLVHEGNKSYASLDTNSTGSYSLMNGAQKAGRSSSEMGTEHDGISFDTFKDSLKTLNTKTTRPLPKMKDQELAHILGTVAAFGGEAIMLVPIFGRYSTGASNSNEGGSKIPGIGPPRVAFVFDYGCVCFFNYDQHEESIILQMLRPFEIATRPRPNVYFKKERQLDLSSTISQGGNTQTRSILQLRKTLASRALHLADTSALDLNVTKKRNRDENDCHSPSDAFSTAISAIINGFGAAGNHALKWVSNEKQSAETIESTESGVDSIISDSSWATWLEVHDFVPDESNNPKHAFDSKEKHQSGLTPREIASGCEELRYCYSPLGKGFFAMNDTVSLKSKDPLEKLAVAFALAQAVKLNVFEARIEQVIQRNEKLSYSLARTGRPGLSKLEISKRIGEIFLERSDVNLHSDILGVPEFFWDEGVDYHDVYDSSVSFLEIPKRVDLLNMRLDVLQELFDILNSLLDSSHMGKLNEVVILLLLMGCILTVFYDFVLKDLGGFLTKPLITRW